MKFTAKGGDRDVSLSFITGAHKRRAIAAESATRAKAAKGPSFKEGSNEGTWAAVEAVGLSQKRLAVLVFQPDHFDTPIRVVLGRDAGGFANRYAAVRLGHFLLAAGVKVPEAGWEAAIEAEGLFALAESLVDTRCRLTLYERPYPSGDTKIYLEYRAEPLPTADRESE